MNKFKDLCRPKAKSGRERFSTGAVRDRADQKPRPELISPLAAERLAAWLRDGAKKYGDRNWEAGMPSERTLASLLMVACLPIIYLLLTYKRSRPRVMVP